MRCVCIKINFILEKSGIDPIEAIDLYRHITENCKHLSLNGIMTIGKFGHDYSQGPNPDFLCLLDCHDRICKTFDVKPENVNISMGMSDDFENAVSKHLILIYLLQTHFLFCLLIVPHL